VGQLLRIGIKRDKNNVLTRDAERKGDQVKLLDEIFRRLDADVDIALSEFWPNEHQRASAESDEIGGNRFQT
jgi:hypothetical protein